MSEEKLNDVEISCNGIDLLVNNDWEGCEKLFLKHKYYTLFKHSTKSRKKLNF